MYLLNPGGTLGDYVPFYFTPFSPMMYNIYTGRGGVVRRNNEDIVILVSKLSKVRDLGYSFLFTDRHAYTQTANFYDDFLMLDKIDWPLLQARNFKRNIDDPAQIERYQAEALIYDHLAVNALLGAICYTEAVKLDIDSILLQQGLKLDVRHITGWYFK